MRNMKSLSYEICSISEMLSLHDMQNFNTIGTKQQGNKSMDSMLVMFKIVWFQIITFKHQLVTTFFAIYCKWIVKGFVILPIESHLGQRHNSLQNQWKYCNSCEHSTAACGHFSTNVVSFCAIPVFDSCSRLSEQKKKKEKKARLALKKETEVKIWQ